MCLHVGVCTEGLVTLEVRDGQFFETAVADSCELCDTGPLEEKPVFLSHPVLGLFFKTFLKVF